MLKEVAIEDIEHYKNTGQKKVLSKINVLFDELREHPETGTGQPKKLKYGLCNYWSRRIDKKNRLVYLIENSTVTITIISALGHYGDK